MLDATKHIVYLPTIWAMQTAEMPQKVNQRLNCPTCTLAECNGVTEIDQEKRMQHAVWDCIAIHVS